MNQSENILQQLELREVPQEKAQSSERTSPRWRLKRGGKRIAARGVATEKEMETVLIESTLVVRGCWEWMGCLSNGYGNITWNGRQILAHVLSYKLFRGPIPAGMFVCHHCDNRMCINPAHLFCGTQADNMRDCVAKGRINRNPRRWGENHPDSKLTERQVLQMRALFGSGVKQADLARMFGVKKYCVYAIVRRINWKHI